MQRTINTSLVPSNMGWWAERSGHIEGNMKPFQPHHH